MVDGTEGSGSFDELNELVVIRFPATIADGGGPARAERKVRGEPEGSRLRTGAADDETEVAGEGGRKYVGVVGTKGGRGGRR